jgi:hypothetical protein
MPRSRRHLQSLVALATSTLVSLSVLGGAAAAAEDPSHPGPGTLPAGGFVAAAPAGSQGLDDLTRLVVKGVDGGKEVIWVAYQNAINPDGTPGTLGGPTASTVAGFDAATGALVASIPVTGKVDGLTADRAHRRLIATVNEDLNSALDLIDPRTATVTGYTYSPSPTVNGNGGTDSIAVTEGHIYLAHSNPADTAQATEYAVTLRPHHIAALRAVFFNNSTAQNAVTGQPNTLALTDPDTNYVMPRASRRFAGQLATIGQADGQIIFASHPQSAQKLTVLNLIDNVPGNIPTLDGLAVATAGHGTLYVVDAGAGSIQALNTTGWPAGTVFVGETKDNGNAILGTLNLSTGTISPLGNIVKNPKGLLFIPTPGNDNSDDPGHGGENHGEGL